MSQPENKEDILFQSLKVFNHLAKANAVLAAADKVKHDSPIGKKLGYLDETKSLEYFKSHPFIDDDF